MKPDRCHRFAGRTVPAGSLRTDDHPARRSPRGPGEPPLLLHAVRVVETTPAKLAAAARRSLMRDQEAADSSEDPERTRRDRVRPEGSWPDPARTGPGRAPAEGCSWDRRFRAPRRGPAVHSWPGRRRSRPLGRARLGPRTRPGPPLRRRAVERGRAGSRAPFLCWFRRSRSLQGLSAE
jgi:hypothetical protein